MKEKLAAFARSAKAKYGAGGIGTAQKTATEDRRVETGSVMLDYALGGGVRVGWITSLYGEKSGGKTTTAIRCMAVFQDRCRNCYRPAKNIEPVPPSEAELKEDSDARWSAKGECTCFAEGLYVPQVPEFKGDDGKKLAANSKKYDEAKTAWEQKLRENSYEEVVCAWIDAENAFDKKWSAKLGLDNRRLFYVRPEAGEDAVDIMHALVCTAEVDVLCIDSIAQLVPQKELTEAMENWQQGLQARIVNKSTRKLVSGSSFVTNSYRAVTQFWINQVREKITMFGDPTVKPGGKGQEFAVHMELKFKKSKQEVEDEQYGDKDEVVKVPKLETFFFSVTKNRTAGTRGVEGSYTHRMRDTEAGPAGQLVDDEEIFKLAMHYLVTQTKKGGASIYTLADTEYTSQKSIAVALRDDKELGTAVRKALLAQMLKGAA